MSELREAAGVLGSGRGCACGADVTGGWRARGQLGTRPQDASDLLAGVARCGEVGDEGGMASQGQAANKIQEFLEI